MEVIVLIGFVWLIGYWVYRSGKSEGSRKGYNVGFRRGRRRSRW